MQIAASDLIVLVCVPGAGISDSEAGVAKLDSIAEVAYGFGSLVIHMTTAPLKPATGGFSLQ